MEPLAVRLRRAFEQALPGIAFDEDVISYFVGGLEEQPEGEWQADDSLVEAWAPFLISHDAASDEDAAREVCRNVLQRLKQRAGGEQSGEGGGGNQRAASAEEPRANGEVPGLAEWLKSQKLDKYDAAARAWCARKKVTSVTGILQQHEEFSKDLELKVLEVRRVKKDADALAAGNSEPDDKRISAARKLLREAAAKGCVIFGPADADSRYIIYGDPLGHGTSGHVKKCILSTEPGKEVAVKVMPLARYTLSSDPSKALARVKREIQNMKALDHPAVVKFYDCWETQETLYVVMELVEGGELFETIMKKKVLSEPEARHIFGQLVDALKYIHSKKLIHRDLKPENILVDKKSSQDGKVTVKISDFGASKLVDDGDSTAVTVVGTRQYWAPEVSDPATAAMGYDERVDLWSLGVVLYVMLEGVWPFDGVGMDENVRRGNFDFKPDSRTSTEARDLIRALIQVKPTHRMSLDACAKHKWVANGG